jgi:hypothetical protein
MSVLDTGFDYEEDGNKYTATKNSTTNHDFKITTTDKYLIGGEFGYRDAVWGDYIEAQVIDIDNILGLGANTVLKQYIIKRHLHPSATCVDLVVQGAGKVLEDLYLRIKYHSVGTVTDPTFYVNYHLYKEE